MRTNLKKNICKLLVATLLLSMIPAFTIGAAAAPAAYTGAPQNLTVPGLAFDESKIVVAWEKPDDYYESAVPIIDYEVFCDGVSLGLASINYRETYPYINAYVDKFYSELSDEHYRITTLSFAATGLDPATEYIFKVRAVYDDGEYSDFSDELAWSTAPLPEIIDAADFGATYVLAKGNLAVANANGDAALIQMIEENTAAIQAAIDAAPFGGKTVLKGSGDNAAPYYYVSGALFLHSNMTFEIEEGAVLLGSPLLDHYPRTLLVYPYSQDIRTYGLLNAVTWDYLTMENIRIVGQGLLDGNGWKYASATNPWQTKSPIDAEPGFADPTGQGWRLPNYYGGSNSSVVANAILASDAFAKSTSDAIPNSDASKIYSTRPNMTVVRGVNNIYYEGITFLNCAHHGIVNYQSENVVTNGVNVLTFNDNNGDGIEYGDCLGITVMNSFWDCGDDVINFASGQGASVRNLTDRVASGEGRVFNNYVRNGHGGLLALGSHTGGWLGDMTAEDNLYCPNESGSVGILRMKTSGTTGGGVRNIELRDNAAHYNTSNNNHVIVADTAYSDSNAASNFSPESEYPVTYENIHVRNLTITGRMASYLLNIAQPPSGNMSKTMVVKDFLIEDIDMISMGTNGGRINVNGVSNFTFRNIRNRTTTSGNFTISSNSRNVTVENCTGVADRYPDNLEWLPSDVLTASVSGAEVALSWPALASATSYSLFIDILDGYGYQMLRLLTPTGTNATLNLKPDTTYKIAVRGENANARSNVMLETTVATTAAAVTSTVTRATNPALTANGGAGSSWHAYRWSAATTNDPLGIQYYKLVAVDEDGNVKEFKAYFDHTSRTGYAMYGLNDGKSYTVTLTAVNWQGVESDPYTPATFTTMPATLMDIPQWAPESELNHTIGVRVGDDIILSWNESDVTDFSNGDTARFAGYRIIVNGVPVQPAGGGLDQPNAKATVEPGIATYTLSTAGFVPYRTYVISVEAGSEILKYSSNPGGGLAGSTTFRGTRNTELARNQVTFGKWTGHGPSFTISLLAENEYIVTFDYNGGEAGIESKIVALNETYGELPEAVRSGYIFNGWSIDGTVDEIVTADTIMDRAEDHSLIAVWEHLDNAVTSPSEFISIKETAKGSNIWVLSFTVTESYELAGVFTVQYDIILNGNNANLDGSYDLGNGFTLFYDIKGNGSTIKELRIVPN